MGLSRASLLIPEQTQLLYRSAAGLDPTEVPPDMLTQSRREHPEPRICTENFVKESGGPEE